MLQECNELQAASALLQRQYNEARRQKSITPVTRKNANKPQTLGHEWAIDVFGAVSALHVCLFLWCVLCVCFVCV